MRMDLGLGGAHGVLDKHGMYLHGPHHMDVYNLRLYLMG